jgi:hypothetical protein
MTAPNRRCANAPSKNPGAWLSLFAMLMIFIGPLISQSMPMEHHAGMSMPGSMSNSMSASMHMSASMDMTADEHAGHAQKTDATDADHALWAKCGYCTLLFSCPALTRTVTVVAPIPPKPADFYNASPQQGHAQRNVFPNARSRAPPRSSVA